jgi:hypothetical protein
VTSRSGNALTHVDIRAEVGAGVVSNGGVLEIHDGHSRLASASAGRGLCLKMRIASTPTSATPSSALMDFLIVFYLEKKQGSQHLTAAHA